MLLEALDNRVNVLPYLSIAARLDDGLVEDAVGLVHLEITGSVLLIIFLR